MKSDRKQNPKGTGGASRSAGSGSARPPANDEAEPTAGLGHAPIWLIVLFALLFYWGQVYLDNHAGGFNAKVYEPFDSFAHVDASNQKTPEQMLRENGKAKFTLYCMTCHQASGMGSPGQYPPLAGSEWVLEANPARLIRIPIHGLRGPITVKGQPYNAEMVGLGMLPDEDIAAILSYIRTEWGNSASLVTPEQVKAVRDETASRTTPWTAEELMQIPVQ